MKMFVGDEKWFQIVILSCTYVFILFSQATAETIPPPTIEQLLNADCIAIGHFAPKGDNSFTFIAKEVIQGDLGVVEKLRSEKKMDLRREEDGRLVFWSLAAAADMLTTNGAGMRIDAEKEYIWFFSNKLFQGMEVQPVEFVQDYKYLLKGEEPSRLFRLLQELDPDMRRQAMEELVAKPEKDFVETLHKAAEDRSSGICFSAIMVLNETKLLQVDRFWGKWHDYPGEDCLQDLLRQRDSERFLKELKKAIIEEEKRPDYLPGLLYYLVKYPRSVYLPVVLNYLDHPTPNVRRYAVGFIWGAFWQLGAERKKSEEAQREFEELSRQVVPLLEMRLKIETDDSVKSAIIRLLEKREELPIVEELSPYSEDEEFEFLMEHIDFSCRELVRCFFDKAFERLKKQLAVTALGYMRDERVFKFLTKIETEVDLRVRLVAIARQNHKESLAELKKLIYPIKDNFGNTWTAGYYFEALGMLDDNEPLEELRRLRDYGKGIARLSYVGALARHNERWAIQELIAALSGSKDAKFLNAEEDQSNYWHNNSEVATWLILVDSKEATEALKRFARETWPEKIQDRFGSPANYCCMQMQNWAGASRRSYPLGELARRDPQWLAELALDKMGSDKLPARQLGFEIFRQLTGRWFDYDPNAFEPQRKEPLKKLCAWWQENKSKSREEWLLSYFKEKGYIMKRLYDRESLLLC